MIDNINFKANYIKPAMIQHLEKGIYKPIEASFIKYDVKNSRDLKALGDIAQNWGKLNYAKSIFRYAKIMREYGNVVGNSILDVYMLILPQDSYEKVEPQNILGCALVDRFTKEKLSLKYLQVNPRYTSNKRPVAEKGFWGFVEKRLFGKKHTEYKHIGKGILDSIKSYYSKVNVIELAPDPSAYKFYEKNGFDKRSERFVNVIEWHRKQK